MTNRSLRLTSRSAHLDGRDISNEVFDVQVACSAATGLEAVISLPIAEVVLDGPVRLSDATKALLVDLGWTPPGDSTPPHRPTRCEWGCCTDYTPTPEASHG